MNNKIKNVYLPIFRKNIREANIGGSAAEMSYYLLLALFPALLLIANVIPLLPIDAQAAIELIDMVLPTEVESLIIPTLEGYLNTANTGVISLSLIFSIWTASTGFSKLQKILNRVYGVTSGNNFIVTRILSFLITILLVIVLGIISLMFVFGESLLNLITDFIIISEVFFAAFTLLKWPTLILVLLVAMLFIFKIVPRHNYRMKYAIPGAVLSSLGITLLSNLFSLYVRFFGGNSVTSGTLGVFIVLMLYLFLSSMMLIMGALVNSLYYRMTNQKEFTEYGKKQHVITSADFPHIDDNNTAYGVLRHLDSPIHFEDNPFKR